MASTLPATAAQPVDAAAPRNRRPRRRLTSIGRPSPWVYAFLAVVLLGSIFPLYWSLLIGSGDSSTLNDPNKSWWPGGNFLGNAAKVINNFAKDHEALKIKEGLLGKKLLRPADVTALAELPSKEVLLAQLLGVLNGPARGFVTVLSAVPRGLVTLLSAYEKKKAEGGQQ